MTSKKERRQPQRTTAITPLKADSDYITRRIKRHLNDLERTNYTESSAPVHHSGSVYAEGDDDDKAAGGGRERTGLWSEQQSDTNKRKKKSTMAVRNLLLYRKTYLQLLEEAKQSEKGANNYLKATAPPSIYPPLEICEVCGYKPNYKCVKCGCKVCDRACRDTHDETRCERR